MDRNASKRIRLVGDLPEDHWLRSQLDADDSLREYAEERAVLEITGVLYEAMERAGLTQSDIAVQLGTSRSFVSQVLSGSRNMTLKTMGAFLWACGLRVEQLVTEDLAGTSTPQHPNLSLSITLQQGDPHLSQGSAVAAR